jgi:hypothetical protein
MHAGTERRVHVKITGLAVSYAFELRALRQLRRDRTPSLCSPASAGPKVGSPSIAGTYRLA